MRSSAKELHELQTDILELEKRKRERPVDFLTLTPKQLEAAKSQARIEVFLGGNQSGKTTLAAWTAIQICRGKHPWRKPKHKGPITVWAISLDFTVSKDVFEQKIRELIPPKEVLRWPTAQNRQFVFKNGNKIVMKSCDSGWRKFQGATIDVALFDEEPSEEIYRETLIRILARDGFMMFTMTPVPDESQEGMTWIFDELIQKQAPGEVEVFEVSVYDNPHLPAASVKKIEETYTGEEREARLKGKIGTLSNLIFTQLRPWHITPAEDILPHWTRYRFIDYGIGVQTACLWLAISPPCAPDCKMEHHHGHWTEDMFHFYREYYEKDRTIPQNAKAIVEMSQGENIRATWIDPHAINREYGSGLTIQQQYLNAGVPAILGSGDWQATVSRGQELFEANRILIGRDLEHFIWELGHYRRVYSRPRTDYKEKPRKRNDHLIDCFRYAMGQRLGYVPFQGDAPTPVFQRRKYF